MIPLKLYWWSRLQGGKKNFGDWLSPLLCEYLSGRPVVLTQPNACDLVAVGSILQRVKNRWFNRTVDIWGTGLIEDTPSIRSRHRYHALRGYRTDACLSHNSRPVYGDPGLLADLLVDDLPSTRQYTVGLVPHYTDQDDPQVRDFLVRNPHAVLLDIFSETREFIRKVASCEVILSSSLHGLVTADAVGRPNAWIRLSDRVKGNDFKFHDYYSAFGLTAQPFPLTNQTTESAVLAMAESYLRPGIERIKANLVAAFPYRR